MNHYLKVFVYTQISLSALQEKVCVHARLNVTKCCGFHVGSELAWF